MKRPWVGTRAGQGTRSLRAIIFAPVHVMNANSIHPSPRDLFTPLNVRRDLTLSSFAACLDSGRRSALEAVRQLAEEAGLETYVVGGPVRDGLLGAPVLDLDFSVEGDATRLGNLLAERLGGRLTVHQRFGTATVDAGQTRVDLVTARNETYRSPGALPDITPGSINDDLARRDFTINAMALPLSTGDPAVIDRFGGIDDLERGLIRSLHGRSFVDDPTRMMRAVRYEQRFGFRIEERTLYDLKCSLRGGSMHTVSGDRWRHELDRVLGEENPGPALLRASELGLLAGVHPALSKDDGLRRLSGGYSETLSDSDWLAALFSPLREAEAEGVIGKLRLAGSRVALARDTIALGNLEPAILAACRASRLVAVLSGLQPAAISAWVRLTGNPQVAAALQRFLGELRWLGPSLTGDDLLEMGVPRGPLMGEILARLREAKLDGLVNGEEEERALARSLLTEGRENVGEQG